jgi:hypothetical protein
MKRLIVFLIKSCFYKWGRLTGPNRSVSTLVSAAQKRYDYYMNETQNGIHL